MIGRVRMTVRSVVVVLSDCRRVCRCRRAAGKARKREREEGNGEFVDKEKSRNREKVSEMKGIEPGSTRYETEAVHGEYKRGEHESMEHTVGTKGSEIWNKDKNQNDDARQCELPN